MRLEEDEVLEELAGAFLAGGELSYLLLAPNDTGPTIYLVGFAVYPEKEVRWRLWPAAQFEGGLFFACATDPAEATGTLQDAVHTHEGTVSRNGWTMDSLTTLQGDEEDAFREISQVILLALRKALELGR